jgi:AcrR family transcriptional regulator
VRRHGWGGDIPTDDAAAEVRILAASRQLLNNHPGVAPTISEVASTLSVTRQTVYRYFPTAQALLLASVSEGVGSFLDAIAAHLQDLTSPAEVVVEGIAFTYEEIRLRPDLSLILSASRGSPQQVTSDMSISVGRSILERSPVNWLAAGFDDDELDGLVELMLRTLQSFIVDPGDPPRSENAMRAYLRRWVGPVVSASLDA